MCHPVLLLPFLQKFDVANARVGAERNPLKTEVIYHVNDLDAAPPEWKIGEVRSLAKTSPVTAGSIARGVAVGSRQFIMDQLLSKANVIRAVRESVQLCQDPQTEFVLLRDSLGDSRINHILPVHGHKILEEQLAVAVYDAIGQPNHASGRAFSLNRSWRRVSLRPSRPPPPLVSAHSTATSKQRQSCMFRRQPRRQTAANRLGTAGTGCRKPDHRFPGTQRPGRAVSVGRTPKRGIHDSLIGLVSIA